MGSSETAQKFNDPNYRPPSFRETKQQFQITLNDLSIERQKEAEEKQKMGYELNLLKNASLYHVNEKLPHHHKKNMK